MFGIFFFHFLPTCASNANTHAQDRTKVPGTIPSASNSKLDKLAHVRLTQIYNFFFLPANLAVVLKLWPW